MNAHLEYIADSLIIEAFAKDNIITAEDNVMGPIVNGIQSYVSSIYDSRRPIASIASFIAPGLLFSMGNKKIAILYEIMSVLGFNWISFWNGLGKGIAAFIKNSKSKPSEDASYSNINNMVNDGFKENYSGQVDKKKLLDIADKIKFASNIVEMNKFTESYPLIKNAGLFSKLAGFFIKTISWLVKTALISLGLTAGSGAVSGLFGTTKQDEDDSLVDKLKVSPNVSREIFVDHPNNLSMVWIEHSDINNINTLLKSWVLNAYPQLNPGIDLIERSRSFQSILNKFKERNRLAPGLGILSVPRPYQRKAEIVFAIVNGYLQEHSQEFSE